MIWLIGIFIGILLLHRYDWLCPTMTWNRWRAAL